MRRLLLVFAFISTATFGQNNPAESSEEAANVVHVQSGMRFPDSVGAFHRKRVNRFNENGSDMGVDYKLETPEGNDYVTVFIYPAAAQWRPGEDEDRVYDPMEKGMICQQELAFRQSELRQFHTESGLGPVKAVDIEQNGGMKHGSRLKFAALRNPAAPSA